MSAREGVFLQPVRTVLTFQNKETKGIRQAVAVAAVVQGEPRKHCTYTYRWDVVMMTPHPAVVVPSRLVTAPTPRASGQHPRRRAEALCGCRLRRCSGGGVGST